jgi:ABC-type multidrug transport system fused ATPase/permease subunit
MMGSLLSNSILLIGGIAMCFVTSWQLSLLAFTTIGPIVHITQVASSPAELNSRRQVYAQWSSHLNRQIFAALATANGHAVEALSNIRTVKAFTTESLEEGKYTDAILIALEKGSTFLHPHPVSSSLRIRDAFGGAGMYAINSYLDLGAGVLILWYGGNLAMGDHRGLTPGQLITFQLYWNMINSAYKGLIDILTNFTRSAGAASRVFALIDALPDIDIDSGTPLERNQIRGEIEFREVDFFYQMRPDLKVLSGINLRILPGTTCEHLLSSLR